MDHQLAITRGGGFVAFSRNARAIGLPDGHVVLGPLIPDALPLAVGEYVVRLVRIDPPPGGCEPPVVEGDVVVLRRTSAS